MPPRTQLYTVKSAWSKDREGRYGEDGRVCSEGIVTKVHAVGIIGGATPLLTGTLTGHPNNRTIYSG